MKIVVRSTPEQYNTLIAKGIPDGVSFLQSPDAQADAYFDLLFESGPAFNNIADKPVFVNAVIETYPELPDNFIRFNGWNTFLQRISIELAVKQNNHFEQAISILNALNWKYNSVPDIPGLIAARVIATIVNEAYFALGEEISTKNEIDIAMKSGTNYPYGPFEWAAQIGKDKVYRLLLKMSEEDERYAPAEMLVREWKTPNN